MNNIVPITDLQRQASQIVGSLAEADEPFIITQRGRATAVLLSAERYATMEKDLQRLDELELEDLVRQAATAKLKGETLSHDEVKRRLGFEK